jgi:hypothetical protein
VIPVTSTHYDRNINDSAYPIALLLFDNKLYILLSIIGSLGSQMHKVRLKGVLKSAKNVLSLSSNKKKFR